MLCDGISDFLQGMPERVSPNGDNIGWIQGDTPRLEKGAHNRTEKIMSKNGYEPDYSVVGISMEYYSYEKYISIEEKCSNVFTFGYYLPCKKNSVISQSH